MVATDEVSLALLYSLPIGLQVIDLVAVRSRQIGAHASVVPSDDDTAPSSGLLFVITIIDLQTGGLVSFLENVGIFVLSDTTEEDDGVGG